MIIELHLHGLMDGPKTEGPLHSIIIIIYMIYSLLSILI